MTKCIRMAAVAVLCLGAVRNTSAQEQDLLSVLEQGGRQAGKQQNPGPQNPNPTGGNKGQKNPPPNDPMSPVYIQQMFDTMAIMEAERFLPLTPEQYPNFVQRLRRLQEARMQGNRRRGKVMNELRSLVGPQAPADVADSAIEAKLKELAVADAEGYAGIHKAIDELDAGLTVRQRARFRMLEENVERRKIDFLTKVRGGGPGFEGIPR